MFWSLLTGVLLLTASRCQAALCLVHVGMTPQQVRAAVGIQPLGAHARRAAVLPWGCSEEDYFVSDRCGGLVERHVGYGPDKRVTDASLAWWPLHFYLPQAHLFWLDILPERDFSPRAVGPT